MKLDDYKVTKVGDYWFIAIKSLNLGFHKNQYAYATAMHIGDMPGAIQNSTRPSRGLSGAAAFETEKEANEFLKDMIETNRIVSVYKPRLAKKVGGKWQTVKDLRTQNNG